jgi:hypothetical protein
MNEHPYLVTKNRKYNNSSSIAIETNLQYVAVNKQDKNRLFYLPAVHNRYLKKDRKQKLEHIISIFELTRK